jgi:hypothetical protein
MPLMLFQVIPIQPSERWMWAMRDLSKGSAMPLTSDAQGS